MEYIYVPHLSMHDIIALLGRTQAIGYSYKDTREALEDLSAARREITALRTEIARLLTERDTAKNHGFIDCSECGGTGKIPHICKEHNLSFVECLFDMPGESVCIKRCKVCSQLFKIRYQWDDGTGDDNIYLMPGEEERGFSFPEEEAAKYGL